MKYRKAVVAALVVGGSVPAPTARAIQPSENERMWLTLRQGITTVELDRVRGGTQVPVDLRPTTVSVILWDEARLPAPPVRNTTVDPRVTGEMNAFQK